MHQCWKLLFRVCDISCSQIFPWKLTYKCLQKAPLQERAAVFLFCFSFFGGKRGLEWWNTHVLIHQLFSHSSLLIASLAVAVQHTHIITDCLALRVSVSDLMFSVLFVIQMHMHGLTYKNGISWYFFYFIQNLWFFTIRRCFRNITSVNFRVQCYADFRATY